MSEHSIDINGIKLTGKKVIIIIIVLIAILVIRIGSMGNKKYDENLMKELNSLLLAEYLPDDATRMKSIYKTGTDKELSNMAKSITTTKVNIESVKASHSIFSFSSKKNVVVKVVYSLYDVNGTRKKGTKYYLFEHYSLGNSWRHKYDVSAMSYYFNFF